MLINKSINIYTNHVTTTNIILQTFAVVSVQSDPVLLAQ